MFPEETHQKIVKQIDEIEATVKAARETRDPCPACDGDGFGPSWKEFTCARCGGSGRVIPQTGGRA